MCIDRQKNMFHLPDVLIDYIYSFDCNTYHKKNYNEVMKELNHMYCWRRTQKFLQHKHRTYGIYYDYHWRVTAMTIAQYILSVSRKYGDCIIVDDMRWIFLKPFSSKFRCA